MIKLKKNIATSCGFLVKLFWNAFRLLTALSVDFLKILQHHKKGHFTEHALFCDVAIFIKKKSTDKALSSLKARLCKCKCYVSLFLFCGFSFMIYCFILWHIWEDICILHCRRRCISIELFWKLENFCPNFVCFCLPGFKHRPVYKFLNLTFLWWETMKNALFHFYQFARLIQFLILQRQILPIERLYL